MARFDSGWVKVWRLHREHWLEKDRFTKAVLMLLVEWANYQDSPPNSKIVLKRGQVATSAVELAKAFKIGRQRIRTSLKLLQDSSVINQSTNHLGTIITICNYEKYQATEKELTTPLTMEQPASNQPLTSCQPLIKELKKERIKEKKSMPPSADAFGAEIFDLSKRWLEFALAQTPTGAENATWTHGHFAAEIDKVCRQLSITSIQAIEMFDFIQTDHDFWMKNAISPFGLLKKSKNGLRKAENIMNAMRRNPVQKTRSTGTNVVQIKPLVGGYE